MPTPPTCVNPINVTLVAGGPAVPVAIVQNALLQSPQNITWTFDNILQPVAIEPTADGFEFAAPVGMPATQAPAQAIATDIATGGQGVVFVTVVVNQLCFYPGLLWDDGGVVAVLGLAGYPTSPAGLVPGSIWSNGGVVSVVPGVTPAPGAAPLFFPIDAASLLAIGGGNLPLGNPGVVSQLWNNGGVVSIVSANFEFLYNDGGVLGVLPGAGYPTSSVSLVSGSVWSNGGAVSVVPGVTPNPAAPAVFFPGITAAELLTLGGGNLPISPPATGSTQLWNNGGLVSVA